MDQYKDILLAIDVMFMNKIPFFVTTSWHVRFNTVEMIATQSNKTLMNSIKQVRKLYHAHGFHLNIIVVDGQFKPLQADMAKLGIFLNMTSYDEHVLEVECYIWTLKERVHACYNILPFMKYPRRLLIEMVYTQNFWLNAFPHPNGILQMMSPKEIITGFEVDFMNHCKLKFGDYIQTHEEHNNDLRACTFGALALQPTGNNQGGYYFYSLTTGWVISQQRYTRLPMPKEVVDQIHHKAQQDNVATGLTVQDWYQEVIPDPDEDDDNDELYHPGHNDDLDDDDYDDDGTDEADDDNLIMVRGCQLMTP